MARKFGPFDTSVFYEVENRRLQRALAAAQGVPTGFAAAPGSGQGAVTAGTGAELVIAAYADGALIDGLYVENPTSETVTLTTNTASTNPRIDRMVMRLDMGAKTIEPFQIVGTPASSPTAPSLTATSTVVDMPLCQYRFPGSASAQNPGSIVDERQWLKRATEGFVNTTTDTNGNIVVPHGLGVIPTGVHVTPGQQATDLLDRIVDMHPTTKDASAFVVFVRRDDTNAALGGNQVQFTWRAFV